MAARRFGIRRFSRKVLVAQFLLVAVFFVWLGLVVDKGRDLLALKDDLTGINRGTVDLILLLSEFGVHDSPRIHRQWDSVVARLDEQVAGAVKHGGGRVAELAEQYLRVKQVHRQAIQARRVDSHRVLHLVLEAQRLTHGANSIREMATRDLVFHAGAVLVGMSLAVAASLGLQVFVSWTVRRRLLEPLQAFLPALDRIGRGDLSVPVPGPAVDEFVPFGKALEQMRASLLAVTVSRDRLNEEVVERQAAERRALELFDELKRAQDNAIQLEKLSALGVFIGGVAHEVGNPLMAVDNYVSYVQDHTSVERHRDVLAKARQEIGRISRIVKDLLLYVRGGVDHSRGMAMVNDGMAVVLGRFREVMKAQRITLEASLPEGLPAVAISPDSLAQILTNLVGNAIAAVRDSESPRIVITAERFDRQLNIAVTDNGPGVPADLKRRIFDPFFTTKPVGQGTGLGLGISLQLAQEAGGSLELAESGHGGATFVVKLPVHLPNSNQ